MKGAYRANAGAWPVALMILIGSSTAYGFADGGPAAPIGDEVERYVTLEIDGGGADPTLRDSIRELLSRLHVDVAPEPVDSDDATEGGAEGGTPLRPFLQIDIDLGTPDAAILEVRDPSASLLVRRTLPRDTSSAILREELAHEVQAVVESVILRQQDRAAEPTVVSEPVPQVSLGPVDRSDADRIAKIAASPHAPSRWGLDISTYAGAGAFADASGLVAHMGIGVAATWASRWRPSLGASVDYVVPFEADGPFVVAHASVISGRLVPSVLLLAHRVIALEVGLGGGLDVITVGPRSAVLPLSYLATSTTHVDPLLSAVVTLHVALSPSVNATLAAIGDMDFVSRSYVLDNGGAEAVVLSPWRVRPALVAGFSFTALGRGLFSRVERVR